MGSSSRLGGSYGANGNSYLRTRQRRGYHAYLGPALMVRMMHRLQETYSQAHRLDDHWQPKVRLLKTLFLALGPAAIVKHLASVASNKQSCISATSARSPLHDASRYVELFAILAAT